MPFKQLDPSDAHAPTDAGSELDLHRALFAAYPDALIIADGAGKIVLANLRAADLLRYPVGELIGLDVDQLVPDAVRAQHAGFRQSYGRAPRGRPMGTQMDLVARRGDGTEVMVEIALSPLQERGAPYVVAAIRDIGAYPRVQQALRRARYSEHLAHFGRLAVDARAIEPILQDVPAIAAGALGIEIAAVYLLNAGGKSFHIAGQTGLGPLSTSEPIANVRDLAPGFVVAMGRAVVVSNRETENRFGFPPTHDGIGVRSALLVPLVERGRAIGVLEASAFGTGRFGDDEVRFLESLANLLSTSLQRAQSEEALDHSQRLEMVGQLTGGIAHDFNNLLTVIGGNLEILESLPSVQTDALGPELVDAATRATRRGSELTAKLLAFSRRQRLEPSLVEVAPMLASLSAMLDRILHQRIRLEVTAAPDCPSIVADPGQLEAALLNIAINARDAMPEGGLLQFDARPCDHPPTAVLAELGPRAESQPFVSIKVTDSGSGMPDHVLERAFEPFFTTKEAGRGTGLGLSTAYGFAKQSHGTLTIESRLGEGTSLTFYLPASVGAVDEPAASTASRDVSALNGLRVLLVEDEPDVRVVASRFLMAMHCEVTAIPSAEEAIALFEGGHRFDLLISDVALGAGMRGTTLADHATAVDPILPVLLMSGFYSELLESDQLALERWQFLAKPYSGDELADAMRRALQGSQELPVPQ